MYKPQTGELGDILNLVKTNKTFHGIFTQSNQSNSVLLNGRSPESACVVVNTILVEKKRVKSGVFWRENVLVRRGGCLGGTVLYVDQYILYLLCTSTCTLTLGWLCHQPTYVTYKDDQTTPRESAIQPLPSFTIPRWVTPLLFTVRYWAMVAGKISRPRNPYDGRPMRPGDS